MKEFIYSIITEKQKGFVAHIIKVFLWPFSMLYGFSVRVRRNLYEMGLLPSYRFQQRVISVGNLTVGGTGKTPLVILIAQWLQKKGIKSAILTRGYMDKDTASDEAAVLQSRLPFTTILVGANRVQNAKKFIENHDVNVFILDDGFQHFKIARDVNIVTIDSTNPWGNGYVLPYGLLREPLSALSRADIFVLTKSNMIGSKISEIKDRIKSIKSDAAIVETIHEPQSLINAVSASPSDLSILKGETVCAFCSIGDPASFEWTLKNLGANVVKIFPFMDHHLYNKSDIESIISFCQTQNIKMIITTHKDAVKLESSLNNFQKLSLFYLEINLKITQGQELFFDRMDRLLRR